LSIISITRSPSRSRAHYDRQLGALLGYTSRRAAVGDNQVDLDSDKFGRQFRHAAEMPIRGASLKVEVLSENEPVPSEAVC